MGYILETKRNSEILQDLLVRSERRRDLLLLLHTGFKTLDEIKDSLKVSSAGIIPQIRKMEENQLIYQINRKYQLTEMGEILAEYLINFGKILRIFGENRKFWSEHKISGIPQEFRLRLHELGNCEIIRSTPTEIFKPHEEYIKNLMKAKKIKIVSSVLHPRYPKYVLDLAEKGADVSIIVTGELMDKIKEKYAEDLERGLGYKNVSVMVYEEKIDIAFTVTDFFLSMRLFLKDDTYDFYQNIMSFEESALKWGEELFSYHEKRSKKVGT